jgi:hypothetical protein
MAERRKKYCIQKRWLGKRAGLRTLKRYCKEIWAEFVKVRDGRRCVLCGETKYLNAHHIITFKCVHTRHKTQVGISVCSKCHKLGIVSAHGTPWILYEWLQKNRPEQWKWFLDNRDLVYQPPIQLDIDEYQIILKDLLAEFEKLDPTIMRRSKYFRFDEVTEQEIIEFYLSDPNSNIHSIAEKYDCSEGLIRELFKRNEVSLIASKRKWYVKPVIKLDRHGNFLEEFQSISLAAKLNNLKISAVANCIEGLSKTSGDFIWIRKGEGFKKFDVVDVCNFYKDNVNITLKDLGKKFHTPIYTIRQLLLRNGIKIRERWSWGKAVSRKKRV